jgi:CBS domain containing-hemolysin-like protein
MPYSYETIKCISLKPQSTLGHPTAPPEMVKLDSPAAAVMTSFKTVHPITTIPEVPIDVALKKMKTAGVRLLFVMNAADQIIGLATAKDIMGERPIQITRQMRVPRADITVAAVMTPQPDICALDAQAVRDARVGDIVETLNAQNRQHALVVESDKATQSQRVIGMFSTSQISKLLGYNVTPEVSPANSLAALVEQIA